MEDNKKETVLEEQLYDDSIEAKLFHAINNLIDKKVTEVIKPLEEKITILEQGR